MISNPSPSPSPSPALADNTPAEFSPIKTPRLWHDNGWMARVVKNEDDDGWAVEMRLDGQAEPALIGPWTMGRDKKNPKPLDTSAFNTLVKTATEVVRRHEQHLHALMHKAIDIRTYQGRWHITLDIVADEFEPYALLAAHDALGEPVAQVRVAPTFKLNADSATRWAQSDFAKPLA